MSRKRRRRERKRQVKDKLVLSQGIRILAGSAASYVGAGREQHTVCSQAVLDGSARSWGKLIQRREPARWESQGEVLRPEET